MKISSECQNLYNATIKIYQYYWALFSKVKELPRVPNFTPAIYNLVNSFLETNHFIMFKDGAVQKGENSLPNETVLTDLIAKFLKIRSRNVSPNSEGKSDSQHKRAQESVPKLVAKKTRVVRTEKNSLDSLEKPPQASAEGSKTSITYLLNTDDQDSEIYRPGI
jgi:hypothetical protein